MHLCRQLVVNSDCSGKSINCHLNHNFTTGGVATMLREKRVKVDDLTADSKPSKVTFSNILVADKFTKGCGRYCRCIF